MEGYLVFERYFPAKFSGLQWEVGNLRDGKGREGKGMGTGNFNIFTNGKFPCFEVGRNGKINLVSMCTLIIFASDKHIKTVFDESILIDMCVLHSIK